MKFAQSYLCNFTLCKCILYNMLCAICCVKFALYHSLIALCFVQSILWYWFCVIFTAQHAVNFLCSIFLFYLKTNWDWAGPSSAQTGTGHLFYFIHDMWHQLIKQVIVLVEWTDFSQYTVKIRLEMVEIWLKILYLATMIRGD